MCILVIRSAFLYLDVVQALCCDIICYLLHAAVLQGIGSNHHHFTHGKCQVPSRSDISVACTNGCLLSAQTHPQTAWHHSYCYLF